MKLASGQVAVVTGAASGIGHALALKLAARGLKLALADIDAGRLAKLADAVAHSDKWLRVLHFNLLGAFHGVQAFVRAGTRTRKMPLNV